MRYLWRYCTDAEKKKFVTPGEIESIRIPADKLNALQGGEIIVQVDKVQEQEA